jgi:hypothetical protein
MSSVMPFFPIHGDPSTEEVTFRDLMDGTGKSKEGQIKDR